MLTTIESAKTLLANRSNFRTRAGLRAECFYRLSGDPVVLGGLTPVERTLLLTARRINESHYMPYCAVCGERIDWDHKELRTWVHVNEIAHDHVVEQTSHADSHIDPPAGLSYVVWSHGDVLAWVLNNGTVHHSSGTSYPHHRRLVREAL